MFSWQAGEVCQPEPRPALCQPPLSALPPACHAAHLSARPPARLLYRYGSNFMKVRALGLTQYDAIILLDSDVAVAGDLSPLFSLPTEFAAVWDQPKVLGR